MDTQDEVSAFVQRRLAKFLLESAPEDIIVTKVEVEDQQTGRTETVNRGES
jgi:hypothetical protein